MICRAVQCRQGLLQHASANVTRGLPQHSTRRCCPKFVSFEIGRLQLQPECGCNDDVGHHHHDA